MFRWVCDDEIKMTLPFGIELFDIVKKSCNSIFIILRRELKA